MNRINNRAGSLQAGMMALCFTRLKIGGSSSSSRVTDRKIQWQSSRINLARSLTASPCIPSFIGLTLIVSTAGKKTFNSLFTKVKAKMQEFDQHRYIFDIVLRCILISVSIGRVNPLYRRPGVNNPSNMASLLIMSHHHRALLLLCKDSMLLLIVSILLIEYFVIFLTPYHPDPPTSLPAPASGTPPPPSTNSGGPPIGASKLGMLPEPTPKRDDDELEYAENPFEEHK